MTNRNTSISRKELFSGSMVIFIGIFYLLPAILSIVDEKKNLLLWPELRMLLVAVFYIISGILLLFKRSSGWVMTAGVLLNFVLLNIVIIFQLSQAGGFETPALMAIMLLFLLLLAFIFLFGRDTRRKFAVNNKSYLLTLGIYFLLLMVQFL